MRRLQRPLPDGGRPDQLHRPRADHLPPQRTGRRRRIADGPPARTTGAANPLPGGTDGRTRAKRWRRSSAGPENRKPSRNAGRAETRRMPGSRPSRAPREAQGAVLLLTPLGSRNPALSHPGAGAQGLRHHRPDHRDRAAEHERGGAGRLAETVAGRQRGARQGLPRGRRRGPPAHQLRPARRAQDPPWGPSRTSGTRPWTEWRRGPSSRCSWTS